MIYDQFYERTTSTTFKLHRPVDGCEIEISPRGDGQDFGGCLRWPEALRLADSLGWQPELGAICYYEVGDGESVNAADAAALADALERGVPRNFEELSYVQFYRDLAHLIDFLRGGRERGHGVEFRVTAAPATVAIAGDEVYF